MGQENIVIICKRVHIEKMTGSLEGPVIFYLKIKRLSHTAQKPDIYCNR